MNIHFALTQKTDTGQRYEIRDKDGKPVAWSVREDFAEILLKRAGPGATLVDRGQVARSRT